MTMTQISWNGASDPSIHPSPACVSMHPLAWVNTKLGQHALQPTQPATSSSIERVFHLVPVDRRPGNWCDLRLLEFEMN